MFLSSKSIIRALAITGSLGLGAGVAGVGAASATTAQTKGTVHVWLLSSDNAVEKILLTGVIGDYGTATTQDQDGKVDPHGKYVQIKLQSGTFMVNAAKFDQDLGHFQPEVNSTTCSVWGSGSGPVTLYDGTGVYAGISGTVTMTDAFAAIMPRFSTGAKKGQCNESNSARPLSEYNGDLTGSGVVTF